MPHNRRRFLRSSAAALTAGFLPIDVFAGTNDCNRPNIVFFLVDDMGWQDTSVPFADYPTPFNYFYRTPNMERLAGMGIRFTDAYACPLCSPTRTSIMTGQNAARHHVTQWTLYPDRDQSEQHVTMTSPPWRIEGLQPGEPTLPAVLRERGYRTIHAGKAHWGAIGTPGSEPKTLGFDINIGGHAAGGPGHYYGTENFGNKKGEHTLPWGVPGLEKYHGQDINLTEALTIEANLAVEDAVKNDMPFYLYMSHYTVHAVIRDHKPYQQPYLDKGIVPVEAAYASMIEGMDVSLGAILGQLEKLGVAENTIVVFGSDNGGLSHGPRGKTIMGTGSYTHNRPLNAGKCSAYEGGIRVPLIVSWAKPNAENANQRRIPIQGGAVSHQPVICDDYVPTFCHWAGIDHPSDIFPHLDGCDITGYVTQQDVSERSTPLIFHFPHFIHSGPEAIRYGYMPFSAMRKDTRKVIYFYDRRKWEIYDLANDIAERHNLADAEPSELNRMALELMDRLRAMGAQYPVIKATGKECPPLEPKLASMPDRFVKAQTLLGIAVEEPDYHVWGCSPIVGPDGKTHLFAARWPIDAQFDPGWRTHSEIAHYLADRPEGPFQFADVALQGTNRETWDSTAVYNPAIHRVGDRYVLLYTGTSGLDRHPANQCIGMAVSESLNGPWRRVGKDGLILAPPDDPTMWNYKAANGVNNPAFLKSPDGRFLLYFKSTNARMGLAIADNVEGPYRQQPKPITANEHHRIEDGYAFTMNGLVYLLTTDNDGLLRAGGGLLWESEDGIHFHAEPRMGFERIEHYVEKAQIKTMKIHYGSIPKFERPQVLTQNGLPAYLYVAGGANLHGGPGSVNYVVKLDWERG